MKKRIVITFFILGILAVGMFFYLKKDSILEASEEMLAKAAWIKYSTPRWIGAGLNPSLMIAEEYPRDIEDIVRRYKAGDFGSYL